MTVTRYRPGQRQSLKEQLLGVMRHTPAEPEKAAPATSAEPAKAAVAAGDAPRKPMKIGPTVKARISRMRPSVAKRGASPEAASQALRIFSPAAPPPGVGTKETKLAMDSSLQTWAMDTFQASWDAGNIFGSAFVEGQFFLGFTYLAELTQRPEYRRISERIATEMTRKWIRLTTSEAKDAEIEDELDNEDEIRQLIGADRSAAQLEDGEEQDGEPTDGEESDEDGGLEEDPEAKKRSAELQLKVKTIDEELRRFGIRDKFRSLAEHDGWYGRGHLYIDTGDKDDPAELATDLGDGTAETTGKKLEKGSLKGFKVIEPMWCYPLNYGARDPLEDDWYNPETWLTMQRQIHRSRLICMVGREVPDILKPAYAFAGLSMSQMAKPYVDNWLRTRQAVTNLVESFSVSGVYTNAQSLLEGGGDEVLDRIEIFNLTRTNAGTMVLDKESEEFFNVSTPLGTLDHLQAQSQEQMSAVSGIPLVVLLGITPTGLNASSEGELRVFYDWIHSFQEKFFRPTLTKVINLIQLNLWGEIDPEINFEFEALWSLDEKGKAEVDKIKAETHTIYIDNGTVSPEEVRGIVVSDPGLPYTGLDPNDVPEPPAQEGLLSGKGGMGGAPGGSENDGDGREMSDSGGDRAQDEDTGEIIEVAPDVFAMDEWKEHLHPRDQGGKFTTGGGGGGGGAAPASSQGNKTFKTKKEHIAHLLTQGTTPKELMQTMGWPSVSMPAQAKALGMKLEKKDGKYFGTPMTDAEKKAAKEADLQKKALQSAAKVESGAPLTGGKEPPPAPAAPEKDPALEKIEKYEGWLADVKAAAQKKDKAAIVKLFQDNPEHVEMFKELQPNAAANIEAIKGKKTYPTPTPEEAKKAAKAVKLQMSYVPGEKPQANPYHQSAATLVDLFNEKWGGKENLGAEQIAEKVHDFKALQAGINELANVEKKATAEQKAAAEKAAKEAAEKAAKEKAEAEAKKKAEEQKRLEEKFKNEPELKQHYEAMNALLGGGKSSANYLQMTANKVKSAGLEKYIKPEEAVSIVAYTGSHYAKLNDEIRSGTMTVDQYKFMKSLNAGLERLPAHTGTTFRKANLTPEQASVYKKGMIAEERAFMSTSKNQGTWSGSHTFEIHGKNGRDVSKLSQHPSEAEVLFKSGTRFLVKDVKGSHIVLEEV